MRHQFLFQDHNTERRKRPGSYETGTPEPCGVGGPIEVCFDGEKEEGACGYGAFAALTETAEAEWSRLLPTWWSVGTLIRTPDPRIGGPIEACFDGEKEEPRSTVEGGPALTKPGLLSRAEGAPTWWA